MMSSLELFLVCFLAVGLQSLISFLFDYFYEKRLEAREKKMEKEVGNLILYLKNPPEELFEEDEEEEELDKLYVKPKKPIAEA